MITAEVAIIKDAGCPRIPFEEISEGLGLVSVIGGIELVPRMHDIPHEFSAEHRAGVILDNYKQGLGEITLPAALNIIYTDKALHQTNYSPFDLHYGYTFCTVGLMLISSMRQPGGYLRGDKRNLAAHEAGHALGVISTIPDADRIHCSRPDCIMSPYVLPEPTTGTEPTGLIEDDVIEGTYLPPIVKTLANDFCLGCRELASLAVPATLQWHLQRFGATR